MIPPESGPAAAEIDEVEEEEEGPRRAAAEALLEERMAIEGLLLALIFPLVGLGLTIEQRDAEETQERIE